MTPPSIPASVGDIDADWVGSVLGRRVEHVSATVIGAAYGFASTVYRIDVDAVPVLVAKRSTAELVRAEEFAYREVLAATSVPRPGFHGALVDGDDGVLVLDHMAAEQGDELHGASPDVADSMLDAVAALHRTWAGRDLPDLPDLVERLRRPIGRDEVDRFVAEWPDAVDPRTAELLTELPERALAAVDELDALPRTVIHADAHLDNVLVGAGDAITLIDFAGLRIGPGCVDVARVAVSTAPPDGIGRPWLDRLVERYETVTGSDASAAVDAALWATLPGGLRWALGGRIARGTRAHALMAQSVRTHAVLLDGS